MTKDINVTLHADKPYANQDITVTQGDFGFNIKAKIVGMDLSNTTASIVFVKPVGIVESNQLTLQNDTYTYVVHGTEFDTPGVIVCDLKIRDNDTQRVSTSRFQILCIEDTLNGASDEPHSYSDTIAQIAERLEGEVAGLSEEVETLSQTVGGFEERIGEVEADVAEIAESIPTKTSDLENDSGFITNEDVPTKISELEDDATHRTVTDAEKNAWDNKSDFSGDYDDLDNKPTIPSKTSDLDNDSNFVSDASYVHTDNNYLDADKELVKQVPKKIGYSTWNEYQKGLYSISTGKYQNYPGYVCTLNPIPVKANDVVSISGFCATAFNIYILYYGESGFISGAQANCTNTEVNFTIPQGCTYFNLDLSFSGDVPEDFSADKLPIVLIEKSGSIWGAFEHMICPEWSGAKTYYVGDYTMYKHRLWKCLVQNAGQTPAENTYWHEVSVISELKALWSAIS